MNWALAAVSSRISMSAKKEVRRTMSCHQDQISSSSRHPMLVLAPDARPLVLEHFAFPDTSTATKVMSFDSIFRKTWGWIMFDHGSFHVLLRLSSLSYQISYSHVHHLDARPYVDQSINHSTVIFKAPLLPLHIPASREKQAQTRHQQKWQVDRHRKSR